MSGAVRPVQKRGFTIAIVEDHHDTREWMRTCLQEEFFVAAHETARDLLAYISANPCDLILSDISLPEMDGFELVASIRSNPVLCHLPIIAVSAHITEADCEKVRGAGFDACIAKPVDLEKMLKMIRSYLNQHNAWRKGEV